MHAVRRGNGRLGRLVWAGRRAPAVRSSSGGGNRSVICAPARKVLGWRRRVCKAGRGGRRVRVRKRVRLCVAVQSACKGPASAATSAATSSSWSAATAACAAWSAGAELGRGGGLGGSFLVLLASRCAPLLCVACDEVKVVATRLHDELAFRNTRGREREISTDFSQHRAYVWNGHGEQRGEEPVKTCPLRSSSERAL